MMAALQKKAIFKARSGRLPAILMIKIKIKNQEIEGGAGQIFRQRKNRTAEQTKNKEKKKESLGKEKRYLKNTENKN